MEERATFCIAYVRLELNGFDPLENHHEIDNKRNP